MRNIMYHLSISFVDHLWEPFIAIIQQNGVLFIASLRMLTLKLMLLYGGKLLIYLSNELTSMKAILGGFEGFNKIIIFQFMLEDQYVIPSSSELFHSKFKTKFRMLL